MTQAYEEEEIEEMKERVKENPGETEFDDDRLRKSLQSSEDVVRANAAFIVARLARKGYRKRVRSFHDVLLELLTHSHDRTRLNAAWALSYITTQYPDLTRPAIQDLINLLTDENEKTRRAAIKTLSKLSDSYKKDVKMGVDSQLQILEQNLKDAVMVLGSYEENRKKELEKVCNYLQESGYDAHLIDELPVHPMMSLQEKVRFWTSAARFCVIIDRDPSGHIYEHQLVKEQRTILALFRPEQSGSTRMFGEEPFVDYEFINTFYFKSDPTNCLDDAIEWAEDIADKRVEVYSEIYDWREE